MVPNNKLSITIFERKNDFSLFFFSVTLLPRTFRQQPVCGSAKFRAFYMAYSFSRNIMRALRHPATGRVPTQAKMMLRKSDQSTLSLDLTRPTNTMEPTLQCVVEIGMPTLEATRTVNAAPSSMQKPLWKERTEAMPH